MPHGRSWQAPAWCMQAEHRAMEAATEAERTAPELTQQSSSSLPSYHSDASLAARANLEEGEISSARTSCPASASAEQAARVSSSPHRPSSFPSQAGSAKKRRPVASVHDALASPQPTFSPGPAGTSPHARQEPASGDMATQPRRSSPMRPMQPAPVVSPVHRTPAAIELGESGQAVRPSDSAAHASRPRALPSSPVSKFAAQGLQNSGKGPPSGIQGILLGSSALRPATQPQQAGLPARPASVAMALRRAAERTLASQCMSDAVGGHPFGVIPQPAAPGQLAAAEPPHGGSGSRPRPMTPMPPEQTAPACPESADQPRSG